MTQGSPIFADEPWGFLLSGGFLPAVEANVDGAGTPRVLTPFDSKPPRWIDGAGFAPKASLAFRWMGKDFQAWHVPCSNAAREGKLASGRDAATGVPVHSLYGETQRPTAAMLTGLDGLVFDDVWFNGWDHLHGRRVPPGIEPMGGAQGEQLGEGGGKEVVLGEG